VDLDSIRITFDPDYPDKVEIERLVDGVAHEGGQFDLEQFITHVLAFYEKNF
jgi:hypothetical protein